MTVGPVFRRMRAAVVVMAAIAALAPAGAHAASTVGATFDPSNECTTNIPLFLQTVSPSDAYVASSDGVLTEWSFQASNSVPNVKLVVARATADPEQFFIVGTSTVKTPVASTTSTFTDVSITVEEGDFIGLRVSSTGDCGRIGAVDYVARYSNADPSAGDTITIPALAENSFQANISASLEPDADGDGLGDETEDPDVDADGVLDATDNCPGLANPGQENIDGDAQGDACDGDDDGDGVADGADNCSTVSNPTQGNLDGDAFGDACDLDMDGDGIANAPDNCPAVANPAQTDTDKDGPGDACDTPTVPDTASPVLGALTLSPKKFQAAKSGPAFIAKVGSSVSFTVSEPATVVFAAQRRSKGRKVGSRCKRQTKSNRKKKRCARWVPVKDTFAIPAQTGVNTFMFKGRIGDRRLKPGRYRFDAVAADAAGNLSANTRKAFRIVK